MYVYRTCATTVVETLVVVHFGIHHKGHKVISDSRLSMQLENKRCCGVFFDSML